MNTPVHLLNTRVSNIAAKPNRYAIRQLAQDLRKFEYTELWFAHLLLKHNGDNTK